MPCVIWVSRSFRLTVSGPGFSAPMRRPSTDTTGTYNHYSALRSYEDLLGLTKGGTDGEGHLGFAAAKGLLPFGKDVFNKR